MKKNRCNDLLKLDLLRDVASFGFASDSLNVARFCHSFWLRWFGFRSPVLFVSLVDISHIHIIRIVCAI